MMIELKETEEAIDVVLEVREQGDIEKDYTRHSVKINEIILYFKNSKKLKDG